MCIVKIIKKLVQTATSHSRDVCCTLMRFSDLLSSQEICVFSKVLSVRRKRKVLILFFFSKQTDFFFRKQAFRWGPNFQGYYYKRLGRYIHSTKKLFSLANIGLPSVSESSVSVSTT